MSSSRTSSSAGRRTTAIRSPTRSRPARRSCAASSRSLDPALVVTLGRFSMATFMPGARIGQAHGTVRPVDPADGRARRPGVRDVPPGRGAPLGRRRARRASETWPAFRRPCSMPASAAKRRPRPGGSNPVRADAGTDDRARSQCQAPAPTQEPTTGLDPTTELGRSAATPSMSWPRHRIRRLSAPRAARRAARPRPATASPPPPSAALTAISPSDSDAPASTDQLTLF